MEEKKPIESIRDFLDTVIQAIPSERFGIVMSSTAFSTGSTTSETTAAKAAR
jgi:hypothetical protein